MLLFTTSSRGSAATALSAAQRRVLEAQPKPVVLQTLLDSPRIRLLHDFVTPDQAEELIRISQPLYHRSSTARATGDEKRTSFSASLPGSNAAVAAVRQRIAAFCGYPEAALEPLQTVRYHSGEFYRPHHDFYNACETWHNGNRHFTFLIYLNEVESGGETTFVRGRALETAPSAPASTRFLSLSALPDSRC